jgi:hypothetical protein
MKKKLLLILPAIAAALVAYAVLGLQVDNGLTPEDRGAIARLSVDDACARAKGDFDGEILCLTAIQSAVQAIGTTECAGMGDIVEPAEFLRRNHGCCTDRARFVEKAARSFGFQTRHLFLIKPARGLSITNMFPLGQSSHATTEVLTSRGWLGVDSNEPFILVTPDGEPMTYRRAIESGTFTEVMRPKRFFAGDLDILYGLYSRHGMFHGPKLPGPEFVFSELLQNVQ